MSTDSIDVNFDFRSDTPVGKDPDVFSPTLRRYHKLLWSKALPGGATFGLDDTTPGIYLHHRSTLGEFFLASDSAIPTFSRWRSTASLIAQIPPEETEDFRRRTYTIGGMIVFPGNQVDRRQTINGAKGFNRQIRDRLDLTVECIRRHYLEEPSPLRDVLSRYGSFFALFESFEGYVQHFLLQDLVSADLTAVRFFAPFRDFATPAVPDTLDGYVSYRQLATEFIDARNLRIRGSVPC